MFIEHLRTANVHPFAVHIEHYEELQSTLYDETKRI